MQRLCDSLYFIGHVVGLMLDIVVYSIVVVPMLISRVQPTPLQPRAQPRWGAV
jgi:hypothetical protein